MGGMGAKEQNFHKHVFERMGYAAITDEVQELFLAGKREEATALIPDELVEDMHIVGDAGHVRERVAAWEETGRDDPAAQPALGRRGAAGRGDSGVSDERNVLGGGAPAVRHRADDRFLPRRLLQHRPGGPRQPHHLRRRHDRVPRPPAQHRQRPVDARCPTTASPGWSPATGGASPPPTGPAPTATGRPHRSCSRRRTRRALELVPLEVLRQYAVDVPDDLGGLQT